MPLTIQDFPSHTTVFILVIALPLNPNCEARNLGLGLDSILEISIPLNVVAPDCHSWSRAYSPYFAFHSLCPISDGGLASEYTAEIEANMGNKSKP